MQWWNHHRRITQAYVDEIIRAFIFGFGTGVGLVLMIIIGIKIVENMK